MGRSDAPTGGSDFLGSQEKRVGRDTRCPKVALSARPFRSMNWGCIFALPSRSPRGKPKDEFCSRVSRMLYLNRAVRWNRRVSSGPEPPELSPSPLTETTSAFTKANSTSSNGLSQSPPLALKALGELFISSEPLPSYELGQNPDFETRLWGPWSGQRFCLGPGWSWGS